MKKIVSLFVVFFVLFSCNNSNTEKQILIKDFKVKQNLTGEFLNLENIPNCPSYITIIDSLLIVMDLDFCNSSLFYIYNKDNYNFLGKFGQKGKGPNEFIQPELPVQKSIDKNFRGIWVYDLSTYKNKLIDINRSLKTGLTAIKKEYITPKLIIAGIGIISLTNGDIIGTSMSQKGRLFYYNNKDKVVRWVPFFPKIENSPQKNLDMMHNLYGGPIKISPDGKNIISALTYFKQIDFFNSKAKHQLSLYFKESPKKAKCFVNVQNLTPDDCTMYYYDLFLSDKYVYALNIEMTYKQSNENKYPPSEIQVFSYQGKALYSYKLDRFIARFCIDEENGYIYGITYPTDKHPNDMMIRYKFKHLTNI